LRAAEDSPVSDLGHCHWVAAKGRREDK
jgi:hypothetical protein